MGTEERVQLDPDRLRLRALLLAGVESPLSGEADAEYFDALRDRLAKRKERAPRRCSTVLRKKPNDTG